VNAGRAGRLNVVEIATWVVIVVAAVGGMVRCEVVSLGMSLVYDAGINMSSAPKL
jgi:hypothetical protein